MNRRAPWKKVEGYTVDYTGDMWARDAALEGARPDLDIVSESSGWRELLPRMWWGWCAS